MGTSAADWAAMQTTGREGRLNVRIMSFAYELQNMRAVVPNGPTPWLYTDHLRMGGIKLYADGALGSRGAWLKQPYADKPDTRGLQFLKDSELFAKADEAAAKGLQVAVHAIGDAANAQVISTYEQLSRKYGIDRRWRIEHFQIVDPADIPRLSPAGIIASMQPTHQTSEPADGREKTWTQSLGRRLRLADRPEVWSKARLRVGLSGGIAQSLSRPVGGGQPTGHRRATAWRLDSERAPELRASAQCLHSRSRLRGFCEDRFGALEPGKWADFILVDRDPTKVDPQALARTQVLQTWVAGRKVWERPNASGAERGR
jgi:predicted amidohydrolase YtcJ